MNHNTKKKKTPAAAKSTLNAINRAGNSSKPQKRSRAQRRSPHIVDDDDNDDDYHQPISSTIIVPPSIIVPSISVPVLQPVVQHASNTTSVISMFAFSQVPKDMGLDNTVDERTRELAQFIRKIEAIPGRIYGLDTELINNLSTNCIDYKRAKKKVCVLHFCDFKFPFVSFYSQYFVFLLFFRLLFLRLLHVCLLLLNRVPNWTTLLNTWMTLTALVHKSSVSTISAVATVLKQSTQ